MAEMTNADLFQREFGIYATELWAMPEQQFLAWLNAPSAQKTGHWIMKEKVYGGLIEDSVYRYECSECGFSDEHNSSREVPFCWHCGARMESE